MTLSKVSIIEVQRDMLVKWNKHLYIGLTHSYEAYSPEWSHTIWEIVCSCSEDEMWLSHSQFKPAGFFRATRAQMCHLGTL